MATVNVPPQAYTRETLAQAYTWLNSQPESIKARAQDADTLVSLYLHACRHGLNVFKEDRIAEAPESTQDFKNTLQNLSKDIHQFEDKQQVDTQQAGKQQAGKQQADTQQADKQQVDTQQVDTQQAENQPPANSAPLQTPLLEPPSKPLSLDPRSLDGIRRVQERMNLSSESEALRLLISLGYDRIRNILESL